MTEEQEEALGTLRGAAEEIEQLHQQLYTRLNQDDIPWGASQDISGEYGDYFDRIAREVKRAEAALSKSLAADSAGAKGEAERTVER